VIQSSQRHKEHRLEIIYTPRIQLDTGNLRLRSTFRGVLIFTDKEHYIESTHQVYSSLAWIKAIQMKIGKISNLRSSRRIKEALDEKEGARKKEGEGKNS